MSLLQEQLTHAGDFIEDSPSPALERRDRGGEQRTEDRWMWLRSDRKECEILTFFRHLRKHYVINQGLSEIYLTLVIGIFPNPGMRSVER